MRSIISHNYHWKEFRGNFAFKKKNQNNFVKENYQEDDLTIY